MITWHIHTDDYGLYSFDTWWLTDDNKRISPNVPAETPNVGDEVRHYTKGKLIDRTLRTSTKHSSDYALVGRSFDGKADHFIAIECHCDSHEVSSPYVV
jgi:hypothetical protein